MCGIIAAFNSDNKPVNEWVIDTYEEQVGRGEKGFGIVLIDKDGSYKLKRATEPVKALVDLNLHESSMILMHHRYPTSTDNYLDQTHPIKVSDGSLNYDYLVVHNGVIINDKDLKKEHEALGFVYNTAYITTHKEEVFNDSECVAIEVARFIEEQTDKIGAIGSNAFLALQIGKDIKNKGKVVKVFFGRNDGSSPLNMSASKTRIRVSSEGAGDEVKPFLLYSFAPGSNKFKKRKMKFEAKKVEPIRSYVEYGSSIVSKQETRPMGFAGGEMAVEEIVGEDYTSKTMKEDMGPKTEEETAIDEIIKDLKEKVNLAMEGFVDELHAGYVYNRDEAQREITDALRDAEDAAERLSFKELSPTTTMSNYSSEDEI
jgi:hypothetical protein